MTKFGLVVPTGFRLDLKGSDPITQYASMNRVATHAEELGYDAIWLFDHLLSLDNTYSCFECWTSLSALAALTNRIRIGTLVTCNSFRHPSLLAKMSATLDVISGGRLEFGIGAGWYEPEYAAYGIPFLRASERVRQLDEALSILKMMWTEDDCTYRGKYYSIKNATCNPKPLQKPHPPVWIAAKGDKMLNLVVKHADGWNMRGSIYEYRDRAATLTRYCRTYGRDISTLVKSLFVILTIAENEKDLRQKVARVTIEPHMRTPSVGSTPYGKKLSIALEHPDKAFRYVMQKIRPKPVNIAGTPEGCAEALDAFKRAGVTHFMLHFTDVASLEALDLFHDEVQPLLK